MRLSNKSIVIIGGTSGIGLAAAQAFVAEGAKVVALGRDDEYLSEAVKFLNDQGRVLSGDATNPESSKKAIALAQSTFGGFDGLYHVAGGSGRSFGDGALHEVTDEGLEKTLSLNFNSLVYSNRAALQAWLKKGQSGVILNLASVLAFSPSPKYFSTHIYAAAKAAIIGLTTSAAAYYAGKNIRINALAPGLVETPMAQRAAQNQEIMKFTKSKQPLDGGRIGAATDLVGAATFFMSEEAKFITGQVLGVDGGWSISEGV